MQLLLSVLYKEWPGKYHHTLHSVLQGRRATHLSKQSSRSLGYKKPFKFINIKYFKFQHVWCVTLLTSGIKPDVGIPMPALAGYRTSDWEQRYCWCFPLWGNKGLGFLPAAGTISAPWWLPTGAQEGKEPLCSLSSTFIDPKVMATALWSLWPSAFYIFQSQGWQERKMMP